MSKTKFITNLTLTHSKIKEKRASLLSDDVQAEQNRLIDDLKDKKRKLERELLNIEEMYPNSTTSLKVGEGVDPKVWVADMQRTKISLIDVQIQLTIANETTNEWFNEND